MRQSLQEHPGARGSTGVTCDGESANNLPTLPTITTAYASHPFSYSTHQQPHHVVGGGGSLGMSLPRPEENQVRRWEGGHARSGESRAFLSTSAPRGISKGVALSSHLTPFSIHPQMLKGGDGRVPPSAMGLLPTPQQVHLDHHRPASLPLGIENNMDSEGSSSHSSSLTQDDTLMFQQLAHLRVSGGARREAGRARGFLYLKW
jgi:hypothetical protein